MNVLLLRPIPSNERFGLGPFFRIEPLGMEYVAAALEADGHRVTLADLRFSRVSRARDAAMPGRISSALPRCTRSRATRSSISSARCARCRPRCRSSSAVTPQLPTRSHSSRTDVAAVVLDDGERALPGICAALSRKQPLTTVAGLALPDGEGGIIRTAGERGTLALDEVPLPARQHVAAWRSQYACLAHRPAWLVETARGCPFRCSFCSIWQLHARAVRERSIDSVCRDLATGRRPCLHRRRSLLVSPGTQSRAGARAAARAASARNGSSSRAAWTPWRATPSCSRRGGRSREDFDIFFGLEAATNEGLSGLTKDATVDQTAQGVDVARADQLRRHRQLRHRSRLGRGRLRAALGLRRTPPAVSGGLHDPDAAAGHRLLRGMREQLRARRWSHFDMHHLLWEPALGPQRFFELYCETWRRSVLNLRGRKNLWQWLREVDPRNALFLLRALGRTQKHDGSGALHARVRSGAAVRSADREVAGARASASTARRSGRADLVTFCDPGYPGTRNASAGI